MKDTDHQDKHKNSDNFKIRPNRTFIFELLAPECRESLFVTCDASFYWIIMKLKDNKNNYTISDELEFRLDRTVHVRVICTLVPKQPIVFILTGIIPSVFNRTL